MELTENRKIEILEYFSEEFPQRNEQIIGRAEAFCLKSPEFKAKSDSEKVEEIIRTIFSTPELISEEDYFLLDAVAFIKKGLDDDSFNNFLANFEVINQHPFFINSSVSKSVFENDRISLELLINSIIEVVESLNTILYENELSLAENKGYFSKIKSIDFSSETIKIKTDLEKRLEKLEKRSQILKDIYQKCNANLKALDNELLKINAYEEKMIYQEKIKILTIEFNKIFQEQEKIIERLAKSELLPLDNILKLPEMVNNISTYLLSYSIIQNFIAADLLNKYEKIEEIKQLEKKLSDNFLLFNDKAKKLFEKGLTNEKDRKQAIKNKFINPKRSDLGEESSRLLEKLIDTVL